jgi:hypothetical protein
MSETLKDAAYTAGKHAADSGLPLSACPFDPGDGQPEQVLALWWTRGYRADNEPADQPVEGA